MAHHNSDLCTDDFSKLATALTDILKGSKRFDDKVTNDSNWYTVRMEAANRVLDCVQARKADYEKYLREVNPDENTAKAIGHRNAIKLHENLYHYMFDDSEDRLLSAVRWGNDRIYYGLTLTGNGFYISNPYNPLGRAANTIAGYTNKYLKYESKYLKYKHKYLKLKELLNNYNKKY
jgi:hypothetical protein